MKILEYFGFGKKDKIIEKLNQKQKELEVYMLINNNCILVNNYILQSMMKDNSKILEEHDKITEICIEVKNNIDKLVVECQETREINEDEKFNLQIFRKKLNGNMTEEEKDKMMQDYKDGKW